LLDLEASEIKNNTKIAKVKYIEKEKENTEEKPRRR